MTDPNPLRLRPGAHAEDDPQRAAVVMAGGSVLTYGELEARSRRLAGLLRQGGLGVGDHVAVLLDNQPAYFDVAWAAQRSGLYLTPVNTHLGAEEAAYIIADCGARALVTTSRLDAVVSGLGSAVDGIDIRLALDGDLVGFEPFEDALAQASPIDPAEETEGAWMFYSSGTTGRPKGIVPSLPGTPFGTGGAFESLVQGVFGFDATATYLCPAPLYHAAPLGWSMATHRLGGTVVVMERFDAKGALDLIARHRVTHAQFVPTHLVRMLKLPAEQRAAADLSSLRTVVHAAAPCPADVKEAVLDWFGPIVHEYYSGSEGVGFCAIGPQEWREHRGSVGRALVGTPHVVGDDGEELGPGQTGQIWFEGPTRFEYHNDAEKTAAAFDERGWSTLGDIGHLDADGYLYLTDRVAHTIISGGVNIYPREIEDVLITHPAVADVAVIGVPDDEMGEVVLALVEPAAGTRPDGALAEDLLATCRARLAGFKCPRRVEFVAELPRLPTGKLRKGELRARFGTWSGR